MKECTTEKAGFRRKRKVRGGIDEFVLQLPPDELIEFLREYCGLDEFFLSLIYGDPEAEKEMIHEAPPISMFGEPSRGKSIFPYILRQMLAECSPEQQSDLFNESQESPNTSPVFHFNINLLNTPGLDGYSC